MENIFIVSWLNAIFGIFGAHNNKFSVRFDQKRMRTLAFIIHNNAFAHKQSVAEQSKAAKHHIACADMCVYANDCDKPKSNVSLFQRTQ